MLFPGSVYDVYMGAGGYRNREIELGNHFGSYTGRGFGV